MKQRLLFLGPPGAGKGTQASLLANKYSLNHFSTGDLLREEVAANSELGQQASEIMNKGELVSDELVLSIVESRLIGIEKGWLLDGFPRNIVQATALRALLDKISQPLQAVILIRIQDSILIERLLSRGREDDNENVIKHRLEVYRNQTAPLIEHYSSQGILKVIDGNADIELVSSCIEKELCTSI